MKPFDDKTDLRTLGELRGLLNRLPRLEDELDAFAKDLEEISKIQPLTPTGDFFQSKILIRQICGLFPGSRS